MEPLGANEQPLVLVETRRCLPPHAIPTPSNYGVGLVILQSLALVGVCRYGTRSQTGVVSKGPAPLPKEVAMHPIIDDMIRSKCYGS